MLVEPCFINGDCGLGLDDRVIWVWEQATYHLTMLGIAGIISGGLIWLKLTRDKNKQKTKPSVITDKSESE